MLHLRRGAVLCALVLALLPRSSLQAQALPPFEPRYDLTANGVIDSADASTAASGWSDLAGTDPCALDGLSALDLNSDGCLDVADVQLLAARVGATTPQAWPEAASGAPAAVWTVDSNGAEQDAQIGDGICRTSRNRCTLRAAIQEANHSVGPDTITFDVRNSDGSCPSVVTINPDSEGYGPLALDDPRGDGTTIDGYTQCGARPNSEPVRGNAVIKIELRGSRNLNVHGLRILSAHNVVRGLALYNWDRQIEVYGGRARYNRIEGNFIGTNAAQNFVSGGLGTHHSEGIRFQIGARHNVLGCGSFDASDQFQPCTDPARAYAARNIIAGNGNDGIHLEREAYHNHIVGNYVGLKQDGETILRNAADGVDFEQGPQHNWLGGLTPLERNVISGSSSDGIEISHGTWTQFNHVVGNYFGLDASGTKARPNQHNGISFEDTVDQNYAYENVVSGNGDSGFRFYVLATRNVVRNNIVGLAADGETPLPNGANGVYVIGGSQNNLLLENVIAHNHDHGIFLASTSDSDHNGIGETYYNTISKNQIFNNRRQGISFYGKEGIYPNQNLAAPRLIRASTRRVEGTACAGCRIEVFLADKTTLTPSDGDHSGEGREFVGEGMADGAGNFSIAVRELDLGAIVTVTATDVEGNSSMFARNIAVTEVAIPEPTVAPTLTSTPPPSATPTTTPEPTPSPEPTATRTPGEAPLEGRLWMPLLRR